MPTPPAAHGIPDSLTAALAGRYRLERELGQGGMATVYLAEDERHRRRVAVKVLKPELAAALGADRFLREIETTAGLRHPHILPLYDSGEAAGFLFYVMPYVEGESLQDRLDREKQLPQDEALRIAREVADALNYAHQRGVIHRDIKPGNIMLESGHAVVADFGIARALSAASSDRLTQTGMAVGTPAYMSPEQAAGTEEVDGRSDLYALGCVLYEMLAGQPPFTGPTVESVVRQHLTAPPVPVTTLRPTVTPALAGVVERALAKNPADRFSPVAQFADALGASTTPPPATAGGFTAGTAKLRRLLIGAGALVLIAIALLAGRFLGTGGPAADNRSTIAVLPFQNLSADGPNAYFAGGLHDELLTQLSKVAALTVMGRTSVMGYAETTKTPQQIGEELGVGSLVEGSVQVLGDRLRVNVQLLDAATGAHRWAESYDRTLDDAFGIQSDIARQVVTAVGAALSSDESGALSARPTENAEAYQLWLQGEDYLRRPGFGREKFDNALLLYERALALDPGFSQAWAGQAEAHGSLYWLGYDARPERLALEQAAAERAAALTPELPAARRALGRSHYHRRDFERALVQFEAAADRHPGSAVVWLDLGMTYRRLGRWDDSEAALNRHMALEPRDATILADLGADTKLTLHRYPEALADFDRALALAPDLREAPLTRALTFLRWRGELDTLRRVAVRDADFESYGPGELWRSRLALWERDVEEVLGITAVSPAAIFAGQAVLEPARLYIGWAHQLAGDRNAAAAAFAGALVQLDSVARQLPSDWRIQSSRGLALAALGRRAEALAEAAAITRSIWNRDLFYRPVLEESRAMIFAQVGLADSAVALLRPLMAGPSGTSHHMLRLDPRWDPIRDEPGFQALLPN